MRLFNILLSLAQKVGAIDDYVVETGTSDAWSYRKWNSGLMEAWLNARITATDESLEALMAGMFASVNIDVPTGFTSSPRGTASAYIGTGAGFTLVYPISTNQINIEVLGNQGNPGKSATVTIEAINITGKWK